MSDREYSTKEVARILGLRSPITVLGYFKRADFPLRGEQRGLRKSWAVKKRDLIDFAEHWNIQYNLSRADQ